jgi:serine/threonine protein kinase
MKLCFACNSEFADTALTKCPHDGANLIPVRDPDSLLGTVISGPYRVEERLHERAGLSVYRAQHETTGQNVCIKAFHLIQDERSLKHFQDLVKNAASLNHRSIIKFMAVGVLPDGRRYTVMDFVPQASFLRQALKRGPLEPAKAIRIFVHIAEILEYAHAHNHLHCAINPNNIVLDGDDGSNVKLMDFGFSRVAVEMTQTKCQAAGDYMRSATYLSPEQCMGKSLFATTDIYSAGITLYECLTGRPPFQSNNQIQAASKHMSEAVPPFSAVNPEQAALIPDVLERVVFRMLAKSPDERYQSMTSLKLNLKDALQSSSLAR